MSPNKSFLAFVVFILMLLIGAFGFYAFTFNGGISSEYDAWISFGAYASAVLSLVAVIGLLYNIHLTKSQLRKQEDLHREQSERGMFFDLIELHLNKARLVTYEEHLLNGLTPRVVSGVDAFKRYSDEFKGSYFIKELPVLFRNWVADNTTSLNKEVCSFVRERLGETFFDKPIESDEHFMELLDQDLSKSESRYERLKNLGLDDGMPAPQINEMMRLGRLIFEKLNSEKRVKVLNECLDHFYKKNGHQLGHYYRNFYYVLDELSNYKYADKWASFLRAQLSRHELAMLYYNALSHRSGVKFIPILTQYDIFNELYEDDLCYWADKETQKEDLAYALRRNIAEDPKNNQ